MTDNLALIEKLALTTNAASQFFDKNGKRLRSDEYNEWSLVLAGKYLQECKMTIDWCGPVNDSFGYETIWEYCAGEYLGQNKKFREKAEFADSHAHVMRNGFNRLKERMLEQWGTPLFMVPRAADRKPIEIITLDKDYVANAKGKTVMEVFMSRDTKMISGQLKAVYQRGAALYGADGAKQLLTDNLYSVVSQPLPGIRANPLIGNAVPGLPAA
jgi:hypothetical protein